jgi:hypothetical protein
MPTYNWEELKGKYLRGNIKSVQKFFRANNLTFSGQASLKTTGWRTERESYQRSLQSQITEATKQAIVETEQQVRERQAKVAKHLQYKALKAVKDQEPATAMESLRMWEVGVKLERLALGLDVERKNTQSNFDTALTGTRYYKRLLSAQENGTLDRAIKEIESLSASEG